MKNNHQRELNNNSVKKNSKVTNRKRTKIVNFRMSEEEYQLLIEKIELLGMKKQDYMINISLNHEVNVVGNIKMFSEIEKRLIKIEERLHNSEQICDKSSLEVLKEISLVIKSFHDNKKDS